MLANFPPLLSSQSRIGMSDYDAIVLSLEARGQREVVTEKMSAQNYLLASYVVA